MVDNNKPLVLGIGLALMWALRWALCLAAAIVILSFLTSSDEIVSGSLDAFVSNEATSSGLSFDAPGSNLDVLTDMIVLVVAAFVIVCINAFVSQFFLRKLAAKGNQLWAVLALVSWPLFIVGCITIFDPEANSFAVATALLAMPLDLLLVAFIGYRIYINKSPFQDMGLIDYVS